MLALLHLHVNVMHNIADGHHSKCRSPPRLFNTGKIWSSPYADARKWGGRNRIGWQAALPACQAMPNRPPRDFLGKKALWIIKALNDLVLFKERATDVAEKRISKVSLEILESRIQVLRWSGFLYRHCEEIDKP